MRYIEKKINQLPKEFKLKVYKALKTRPDDFPHYIHFRSYICIAWSSDMPVVLYSVT